MRSIVLDPPRLFTQELRDAGYYVSWPTKRDFNFNATEPGEPNAFADDCDLWQEKLRNGSLSDRPFFLFLNLHVTHESTMWPATPPGEHSAVDDRLESDHLLADSQRHDPASAPVPAYLPDSDTTRTCLARYYDALSIQDAQAGAVLGALAASPYADNTIVVYLTDHGRGMPREKRWCYDAGLHLPLIIRDPRGAVTAPGMVSEQLVSWVDIAPTILALTDTPIPASYEGRVFLGPMSDPPRDCVFAGRDRMGEAYDHVRVARDGRWHYIRNTWPKLPYAQRIWYMERMAVMGELRAGRTAGTLSPALSLWMSETKPAEELYDALADPQMLHNLADAPQHTATLARLRAALDDHLVTIGDLARDVSERQLVSRGLLRDDLPAFRSQIKPLPPEHRIGPAVHVLEMEEARMLHGL